MIKIWRIGYLEDEETHYTQPFVEDSLISAVYKDFDRLAMKSNLEFWVESAMVEWVREG